MFLKNLRNLTRRVSIRLRLSILFVVIFGTSLIAFGVGTFEYLAYSLQKEFDDALYNYAVDVTESVTLDPSGDLSLAPPQLDRFKIYPFSLGTALIQIRHRNGKILEQVGDFGEFQLPYNREVEGLSKGEDAVYRTINKIEGLPSKEAESYRAISFAVDTSSPPQLILQIAVPMTLLENQLAKRKWAFELGIPLILLFAAVASYFLAWRALRPITSMIEKSQAIGVTSLSERLPLPAARDEVHSLAVTLNNMMDRLEKSFQSQERFVADASHQLLTPLTILKGELEQAQRQGHWSANEIESLLQEVDRLAKLVQDLLLLARVDAGQSRLQFSSLFLEDVILEAIGRAEKLARPRQIRISFNIHSAEPSERAALIGAEDLLFHLVLNLLENALKYSPDGGSVSVALEQSPRFQILTVTDSGSGISSADQGLIFERFRRGSSPPSSKPVMGYGLGLAIASQIAQLHKGRLWAENQVNSDGSIAGAIFHFEIKNF
ncbi:MAG: ATP-binding protein [Bdellovibrio sp.]